MNDALVMAHGAFHGPWCWQPTTRRLEVHGLRCVAVDLDRGGLEADRAALQGVVDALREEGCRVHAIGHSLGCCPVALLDPDSIASAILLAGPVVGPGMPDLADCTVPDFVEKLLPRDDGRASMSREEARATFYHRCSETLTRWAVDRLRPTFVYGAQEAEKPLWQTIPVTYVVCSDDRAVRPEYQRAAAERCPYSETIDTDHSPMLGRPDELAAILQAAIGRAS